MSSVTYLTARNYQKFSWVLKGLLRRLSGKLRLLVHEKPVAPAILSASSREYGKADEGHHRNRVFADPWRTRLVAHGVPRVRRRRRNDPRWGDFELGASGGGGLVRVRGDPPF